MLNLAKMGSLTSIVAYSIKESAMVSIYLPWWNFVARAVGLRRKAEMPGAFLERRKCEDMNLHPLLPVYPLPIFELPCINANRSIQHDETLDQKAYIIYHSLENERVSV